MAIVDQYGSAFTYGRKFAHGATRSRTQGEVYSNWDAPIDKLIPSFDRKTLVVMAKRLFTNIGVPKAVISQKADYSVGDAYVADYRGPDWEAGNQVERWLEHVFYPNCDVRGGIWDWKRVLEGVSQDLDFGDSFTLLTTSADGLFPQVQNISSWRVHSCGDTEKVTSGTFKGYLIKDGIIYNKVGRTIAYRVRDALDPDEFDDIPANSIIHQYDPDFADQGRGFPCFMHAINDLKACLQSTEYERIRQMILSSIGLIEYNEQGGPDLNDPAIALGGVGECGEGIAYEEIQGGTIRYMKSNSGEKLEQIKHESPGDIWESFQDRMLRGAVIGAEWSYAMVWKSTGQGTAERADVLRARRAVAKRQRILDQWARRVTSYAYAMAAASNRVPTLKRPTRWGFTHPPQLTVDDGRESKAIIEGWRAGVLNMTQVVEAQGKTIEEHYMQRAREVVMRKEAAANASKDGITVDDRDMAMLTPNEPATAETTETNETFSDSE